MARTYNPSSMVSEVTEKMRTWMQSLHKEVNGGLDFGNPTGNTPTSGFGVNNGVYTQFERGNGSGVLVRIAANGVTGTGASYNWDGSGQVVINHGLLKQPIGFKVVDVDKDARIYRSAAPDSNTITLSSTDKTASVTVYIF